MLTGGVHLPARWIVQSLASTVPYTSTNLVGQLVPEYPHVTFVLCFTCRKNERFRRRRARSRGRKWSCSRLLSRVRQHSVVCIACIQRAVKGMLSDTATKMWRPPGASSIEGCYRRVWREAYTHRANFIV